MCIIADHHRYLIEIADKEKELSELTYMKQKATENYEQAFNLSMKLHPVHPVRLQIAFNYTKFLYECLNKKGEAHKKAKELHKEGLDTLHHSKEGGHEN